MKSAKKIFAVVTVVVIMFITITGTNVFAWSESSIYAAPMNTKIEFFVDGQKQTNLEVNVGEEKTVEARINFDLSTPAHEEGSNPESDTLPTCVKIESDNANVVVSPIEKEITRNFQLKGLDENITISQEFTIKANSAVTNAKVTFSADVNNEDITYAGETNTVTSTLFVTASESISDSTDTLTQITSANITLKAPKVGDKVTKITKNDGYGDYEAQSSAPTVTTTTKGLNVNAFWVKGLKELSEEPFYGTFEEGKYYYALIDFEAQDGYELPSTFPDGIKINGAAPEEVFAVIGGRWNHCIAKVKATSTTANDETTSTETTYEYKEGANQTYKAGEDETATFRVDADFSLFENGGAVYVDDVEVDSKNYTAKSGSTVITLSKEYMSSLSEGEHTLKVTFNNGGNATTKFSIAKTNTATSTETTESKKETTGTTSSNPKTGDSIAIWVSLAVISILGIAGIKKYRIK